MKLDFTVDGRTTGNDVPARLHDPVWSARSLRNPKVVLRVFMLEMNERHNYRVITQEYESRHGALMQQWRRFELVFEARPPGATNEFPEHSGLHLSRPRCRRLLQCCECVLSNAELLTTAPGSHKSA